MVKAVPVVVLFVMMEKSWPWGTWKRFIPKATLKGAVGEERAIGCVKETAGDMEFTNCGPG